MKTIKISVSGGQKTGKSTICNIIADALGNHGIRVSTDKTVSSSAKAKLALPVKVTITECNESKDKGMSEEERKQLDRECKVLACARGF